MIKYRIIMSPRADAELDGIHDYIAHDSPANALAMVDQLLAAIDSLELFPHRSVAETQSRDLRHPVRSLPVPPYVIYFRVLDEDKIVRILHIRHGARRQPVRADLE